jgi:homoserine kinase type II
MAEQRVRETFAADELAIALSHYSLGVIESIREFRRGSRKAPKVVIVCEKGKYLFKRRAKGVESIEKVAFTHQIQIRLAQQSFPLPHLLGTRDENNSMLVMNERIYEMQEFIEGGDYDGSPQATGQAGQILGLYHKLLEDFESDFEPLSASYHDAKAIHKALVKAGEMLRPQVKKHGNDILNNLHFLQEAYRRCCEGVNRLGLKDWPPQIVHGDWHPGNMLFRNRRVAAVIDYDTARLQQRVIDLANGALQFSLLGGGENPDTWPENLDVERFRAFLQGYDGVNVISTDELRAIPCLMCEAMIAEAVIPIAATGGFGRFPGGPFLRMIRKKVEWILTHLKQLKEALSESASEAPPAQEAPGEDPLSGLAQAVERNDRNRRSRE